MEDINIINDDISSSTITIFYICLISVIVLILSSFFKSIDDTVNRISGRIAVISSLVFICVLYLNYLGAKQTNQSIQNTTNLNLVQLTNSLTDRSKNSFLNTISSIPNCSNMISEFYFSWQNNSTTPTPTPTDNKSSQLVVALCLFQNIEDYITAQFSNTNTTDTQWLCFFSRYLVSPTIQEIWTKYNSSYIYSTRCLINSLIFIINENKNKWQSEDDLISYYDIYTDSVMYNNLLSK